MSDYNLTLLHGIKAWTEDEIARATEDAVNDAEITDTINQTLAKAKASGEFDGDSVTITSISQSTTDGGYSYVYFSNGKSLQVKNGSKGATPNLTIGTVSTLAAGSNATATITGTTAVPKLNLGIPKGEDGKTPAKGVDYFTDEDKEEIAALVEVSGNGSSEWQKCHEETLVEDVVYWVIPLPQSWKRLFFMVIEGNDPICVNSSREATSYCVSTGGSENLLADARGHYVYQFKQRASAVVDRIDYTWSCVSSSFVTGGNSGFGASRQSGKIISDNPPDFTQMTLNHWGYAGEDCVITAGTKIVVYYQE